MMLVNFISKAAETLECSKLKPEELKKITPALKQIKKLLNLECIEEAIVFVAVFGLSCQDEKATMQDLTQYFNITALEATRYMPYLATLSSKRLIVNVDRFEPRVEKRGYKVPCDVYEAILEGRDVKASTKTCEKKDQFDFCQTVEGLVDSRKRNFSQERLFDYVLDLEKEYAELPFVQEIVELVPEVCARAFFYYVCSEYCSRPAWNTTTTISDLTKKMLERVIDRAALKTQLIEGTHILISSGLLQVPDTDEVKVTYKALKHLFRENVAGVTRGLKVDSRYEFVKKVADYVSDMDYHPNRCQVNALHRFVVTLEQENPQLTMLGNITMRLSDVEDRILFYLIANEAIDGDKYGVDDIEDFCERSDEIQIKRKIKEGTHALVKTGLIEFTSTGLFEDAELFLTQAGRETFFEEEVSLFETVVTDKNLIAPDKIAEKELFFEDSLERQLDMLRNSLTEHNYQSLRDRLAEKHLSQGIAVLLYGLPGTGKTESVMQIARATGRAVMHVDISQTKTCWFGESEKLIKEVFTNYRKLCEKSKLKPILLFNEADAVFSKRKDSGSSSVAQTENAIQNIILEEMERLDGILIATTNLADNLDKAFERRFLFKIRFDRPAVEAKQKIWASKLPTLSADDARRLAVCYDFSGGEIDNIARKAIMAEVLNGTTPGIDEIITICDEEKIATRKTKVGF